MHKPSTSKEGGPQGFRADTDDKALCPAGNGQAPGGEGLSLQGGLQYVLLEKTEKPGTNRNTVVIASKMKSEKKHLLLAIK